MDDLFDNYGFWSGGIFNVTPREAFELSSRGALIVDVREENLRGLNSFDVPGLIYMPKSIIEQEYKNLLTGRYLIFADTVGLRSREAVIFLKEIGFEKIANMAGGIVDWEHDGLPLKTNLEERLSGSCMCQLKPRERKKTS
jgi:rhodanese-related sulfurtransferase